MYELLAVTGARNAQAAVAETATASRVCPPVLVDDSGSVLTASYLPMAAPRLGDASAGIRFVMRTRGTQHVVYYRDAIVVAWRGVYATVASSSTSEPDRRELENIARTAVQKLGRAHQRGLNTGT